MLSLTRRTYLQIGGSAAALGLAGCTEFLERETASSLTFLLFHNYTSEEHSVNVQIEDEDELAYRETVNLDPNSSELLPPEDVESDGYPTEPGVFTLAFNLHGRDDNHARAEFDLREFSDKCIGFTAEVAQSEQNDDGPRLSVFYTTGCEHGG